MEHYALIPGRVYVLLHGQRLVVGDHPGHRLLLPEVRYYGSGRALVDIEIGDEAIHQLVLSLILHYAGRLSSEAGDVHGKVEASGKHLAGP